MMASIAVIEAIERVAASREPILSFVRKSNITPRRLGVFASSFNPVTIAHVELVKLSVKAYLLDEALLLSSCSNADKQEYECTLEDRVEMVLAAYAARGDASIGLCSSAFFVDMIDAIRKEYGPSPECYFILGFDTFERLLDQSGRYFPRYQRRFETRTDAFKRLFSQSSVIVAGRGDKGARELKVLVDNESVNIRDAISFLDFPGEYAELSATKARARLKAGLSIEGLVPLEVAEYIKEHRLYGSK